MNCSLDLALAHSRQKRRLPLDLHTGKLGRHTIVVPPLKHTRHADGGDIGDVGDVDSEEGRQDLEATQVVTALPACYCFPPYCPYCEDSPAYRPVPCMRSTAFCCHCYDPCP